MIEKIIVSYENMDENSIISIDTEKVQFSFSNNVGVVGSYTTGLTLVLGTTDKTFKFKDFFNELKNHGIENISQIMITTESDECIYTIKNKVKSIIYNINFSGMGDSITFDCEED